MSPKPYSLKHATSSAGLPDEIGGIWSAKFAQIIWAAFVLFGFLLLLTDFLVGGSLMAVAAEVSPGELPKVQPGLIHPILEKEIIGKALTMTECQHYCDARVPTLPYFGNVTQWQAYAEPLRQRILEQIVFRGRAKAWRDSALRVEWLEAILGGPGYRIRKLRFEALPGMWIPALLYEPETLTGKVPGVLNVNGHTPLGKQYPPKQLRCINQAKRGIIALNVEWVGMGQLRTPGFAHSRMHQLDLCGASGLAPFFLNMQRALDLLLSLEHVDPNRVAMTGLSGGGWQTIVLSSLDPRIALANPVAGYSSFKTRAWHLKDLGEAEQTPCDLATLADYTHLTALMAPRPLLLTYNSKDECCFESGYALEPLVAAAQPIYALFGREEALRTHINDEPGTHNYEVDNRQAFYRMLRDYFYSGDESFDVREIPSETEIKSEEELAVSLPEPNEDFHTLALKLAQQLPADPEVPQAPEAFAQWQASSRKKLGEVVRIKQYTVHPTAVVQADAPLGEGQQGQLRSILWRLAMDDAWTVPAVELQLIDSAKPTDEDHRPWAILVGDHGRAALSREASSFLNEGYRVLLIDPFYFGESRLASHSYLFAILVATVGDRPLGIQASQVAAVARWLRQRNEAPVLLAAFGNRSSTFSLIAAALEREAIHQVQLQTPLGSLKEVIENDWAGDAYPELFCFGLLEAFDLYQIAALVHPRTIVVKQPSARVVQEFSRIGALGHLKLEDSR